MSKKKKILLSVGISLLVLVLIVGIIVGVVINNKKKLPKNKIYGIEYKVLHSEIYKASFDRSSHWLTMDMDLHITLRNKTNKDFIFNPDALYLYVEDSPGTIFENGTKKLNYAEDMFVVTQTIPANNAICSLNHSITLKLYHPYGAIHSRFIEFMRGLRFTLYYNGEKVFEFSPNEIIGQVEGDLDG